MLEPKVATKVHNVFHAHHFFFLFQSLTSIFLLLDGACKYLSGETGLNNSGFKGDFYD
jgi:hypothetical protein